MADPSRTGDPRFYCRPANLSVQSSLRNPFCETYRLVRSPGPRWSTSASRVAKPVFSARVAAWILPPPTRWKPSRISPTISISALPGPSRTAKSAPVSPEAATSKLSTCSNPASPQPPRCPWPSSFPAPASLLWRNTSLSASARTDGSPGCNAFADRRSAPPACPSALSS